MDGQRTGVYSLEYRSAFCTESTFRSEGPTSGLRSPRFSSWIVSLS